GVDPVSKAPDTYADFLRLSSQLGCEASLRCCGTVCTPPVDAAFYNPSMRSLAYLDAGLFAYDAQAAIDCLTAMQQRYASCDAAIPTLPPNTACSKVLRPKAAIGGRCETGINTCAADAVCLAVSNCSLRKRSDESCGTSGTPYCQSELDSCC